MVKITPEEVMEQRKQAEKKVLSRYESGIVGACVRLAVPLGSREEAVRTAEFLCQLGKEMIETDTRRALTDVEYLLSVRIACLRTRQQIRELTDKNYCGGGTPGRKWRRP